jgi:hypothetical protein
MTEPPALFVYALYENEEDKIKTGHAYLVTLKPVHTFTLHVIKFYIIVGITIDYWLDYRVRFPARARDIFSLLCNSQTGSKGHPTCCTMGTSPE